MNRTTLLGVVLAASLTLGCATLNKAAQVCELVLSKNVCVAVDFVTALRKDVDSTASAGKTIIDIALPGREATP